ncbi:MAG: phage terminase small subunit P27 family [Planctomycetes bacterium]|nr:phage terminase small subunit P27 family [Planctomycetota bacterium]
MPRGRPPKPSTVHWLNGDPSRTRRYEVEPSGAAGLPDKPADLGKVASSKWDELVPLLSEMRVLTRSDAEVLRLYCETFARYIEASKSIADGGMTTCNDSGTVAKSPYVAIVQDCSQLMAKLLIEFGFSPAARARMRMKAPEAKPVSKWDGKLKVRRA